MVDTLYSHENFKQRLEITLAGLYKMISEKNLAYGNSYEVVPAIMKQLYPNGVAPDQMDNMLLLVRVLDKVKRIVTDNDPMGEDPWSDIVGYGILKLTTRPKLEPVQLPAPVTIITKPPKSVRPRQPRRDPNECSSECTGRCAGCDRQSSR